MGALLDEAYISNIKREKDQEKAHQYNRRTDFRCLINSIILTQLRFRN